jgi:hypothetical protein
LAQKFEVIVLSLAMQTDIVYVAAAEGLDSTFAGLKKKKKKPPVSSTV